MSESESDLSSDDLSAETASWIAWFCSIRGNEFFCQVDEEYITDSFNLSGLKEEVPYYDMAVETILDGEHPSMNEMTEAQQEAVDSAAELLYGLIHARFIITAKGLTLMVRVGRPGWQGSWRRPAQATASLLPSLPTRSLSPLPSSPPPPPPLFMRLPVHALCPSAHLRPCRMKSSSSAALANAQTTCAGARRCCPLPSTTSRARAMCTSTAPAAMASFTLPPRATAVSWARAAAPSPPLRPLCP